MHCSIVEECSLVAPRRKYSEVNKRKTIYENLWSRLSRLELWDWLMANIKCKIQQHNQAITKSNKAMNLMLIDQVKFLYFTQLLHIQWNLNSDFQLSSNVIHGISFSEFSDLSDTFKKFLYSQLGSERWEIFSCIKIPLAELLSLTYFCLSVGACGWA